MLNRGDIYTKSGGKARGSVRIVANRKLRLFYKFAKLAGASLITFGLVWIMFTFGPVAKEEIRYNLAAKPTPTISFSEEFAQAQETSEIQWEAKRLGLDPHFSIYVPKIDARANVIANVDTSEKSDYMEAIQKGVAHARGTYFPGQGNKIYLFAHSTDTGVNFARYNAIFYLLRKLEVGDDVIIYFADNKYKYNITGKKIVSPHNVEWLAPTDKELLIMQTCDPPGTTINRLLLFAEPA